MPHVQTATGMEYIYGSGADKFGRLTSKLPIGFWVVNLSGSEGQYR